MVIISDFDQALIQQLDQVVLPVVSTQIPAHSIGLYMMVTLLCKTQFIGATKNID